MFGLSSLEDIDAYVARRWGKPVATVVALLVTLALVSACLLLIAAGVKQALPAISAVAGVVSGGFGSIAWKSVIPGLMSLLLFGAVVLWIRQRLAKMASEVEIISGWLSEPLENRLKDMKTELEHLRENTAGLEATNQVFASVDGRWNDLTARVSALEAHTDISGLRRLLTERFAEAAKNKQTITIGDLLRPK